MSRTHKRRLANYLLEPFIQVKLGLYAILLALIFCFGMIWLVYETFHRFYDLILELTDLREEVTTILNSFMGDMLFWSSVGTSVYFILTVAMSIFYTHRLIGPTYAFRRHVKELTRGNYKSRVCLRKSDAFAELAEDLNDLAATMENKGIRATHPPKSS
ncbi:MAG: hypothetical protein HRU19_13425 [Pseudobacteriovorax sp.]|nr:hypothetical protein [Pseudobacteriovorax sp.]